LRESVREIIIPTFVQATEPPKAATKPLASMSDDALLGYGVPAEWLVDVREADEDALLALAGHLPAEAAEAVLELATGGTPQVAKPEPSAVSEPLAPFTHPGISQVFPSEFAQREFAVLFTGSTPASLAPFTRNNLRHSPLVSTPKRNPLRRTVP
jgi:hypothetical protein